MLNIHSQFSEEELCRVRQRPMRAELTDPPTEDEVWSVIGKLQSRKAGGASGILPKMVKATWCEDTFRCRLVELVEDVWKESSVPCDWRDVILAPIPKKGDLTSCDNWHGISLLEVVGKVVAQVIQERLQKIAEEELPESQCGFRKGRSCADMIFTVRQLVEKSWEHRSKAFFTFIDLKKAYDSVPRKAMWIALAKLGVPESTVTLIRSFHKGMKAAIRLGGKTLEEITVENGLRQGCCMAPVLFNLYMCLAVERWLERVEGEDGVGITVKYKMDGKLFRRYTRNSCERRIAECQFADDSALLASTRSGAVKTAIEYQRTGRDFGLTVSIPKTKQMVTGRLVEEGDHTSVPLDGGDIDVVEEFPYLGSKIGKSGRVDMDVDRRIAQVSKVFGALSLC